MIRHIVMWKFREGTEEKANEFLTKLAALDGGAHGAARFVLMGAVAEATAGAQLLQVGKGAGKAL